MASQELAYYIVDVEWFAPDPETCYVSSHILVWFACAKYRTWVYHKLFCQILSTDFPLPKANKIMAVTRFWWTISSPYESIYIWYIYIYIYLWYIVYIYIYHIDYILIPRVYFPTSLRVVHFEVRNFVLRQVTKHATWRHNGTECWWKQKSNTGWFDDLWLRIWKAQHFFCKTFLTYFCWVRKDGEQKNQR